MKPAPTCSVKDGCIARVHCRDLGYCKETHTALDGNERGGGFLPSLVARSNADGPAYCAVVGGCTDTRQCNSIGYCKTYLAAETKSVNLDCCGFGSACSKPDLVCGLRNDDMAKKKKDKPANPKQLYGDAKLPLYLVPLSFVANVSVALFEGMRKYGLVNWRAAEVETMTYVSALDRHVKKWVNGERCDPVTKVHHLANAAACLCILIDAEVNGTLIDNRPLPCANIDPMIAELEATLANLKQLHGDKNPKHYTIGEVA